MALPKCSTCVCVCVFITFSYFCLFSGSLVSANFLSAQCKAVSPSLSWMSTLAPTQIQHSHFHWDKFYDIDMATMLFDMLCMCICFHKDWLVHVLDIVHDWSFSFATICTHEGIHLLFCYTSLLPNVHTSTPHSILYIYYGLNMCIHIL